MQLKSVELPFGKTIYQTIDGQSISNDTAYLVDLILKNEENIFQQVLELGCGNGIISIMLKYYRENWNISGIDIQSHLVDIAVKNANLTKLSICFMQADLKRFSASYKHDLIVANPPYFPVLQGRISPNSERAISRHEILCSMYDVFDAIKRNLKVTGKAYLIYPESRLKEIEEIIEREKIKLKEKTILNQSFEKKRMVGIVVSNQM